MRKSVKMAIGSATLVLAGSLFSASAFADTTGTGVTASSPATSPSTSVQKTAAKHHLNWGKIALRVSSKDVATKLDLSLQQFHKLLASGDSIDDVITAQSQSDQGVTQSDIQTIITNDLTSKIQTRVTAGHMSQDKATKLETALTKRIPTWMSKKHIGRKPLIHKFEVNAAFLKQVATDLNMTESDLMKELKSGNSITAIAQQAGINESTLQTNLNTWLDTKLNAQVSTLLNKTWGSHKSTTNNSNNATSQSQGSTSSN